MTWLQNLECLLWELQNPPPPFVWTLFNYYAWIPHVLLVQLFPGFGFPWLSRLSSLGLFSKSFLCFQQERDNNSGNDKLRFSLFIPIMCWNVSNPKLYSSLSMSDCGVVRGVRRKALWAQPACVSELHHPSSHRHTLGLVGSTLMLFFSVPFLAGLSIPYIMDMFSL